MITQWYQSFLATDRQNDQGKYLFHYRVTDEEFSSLEQTLRHNLAAVTSPQVLQNTNYRFCGLFVLYAAEWWRRRYNGSHWSWKPILEDLNADDKPWNATDRGKCVERGLQFWKLPATQTGGLKYLSAIALQGGLPIHLLAQAKGTIGALLVRVIRHSQGTSISRENLKGWISSLSQNLPASYQNMLIYELLSELIATTRELVDEAKLTAEDHDLQRLDERVPAWRDRLPLSINDGEAQELLKQLIAGAVQPVAPPRTMAIERYLDPQDSDVWTLYSELVLPAPLPTETLLEQFTLDEDATLGRALTLSLQAGKVSIARRLRKLSGHKKYRMENIPQGFSGINAAAEHHLELTTAEGHVWRAQPRRASAMLKTLPWLFEEREGRPIRWVSQGGGGLSSASGIVALQESWRIEPATQDSTAEMIAFLQIGDEIRELYRVNGIVAVFGENRRWRIRSGQRDAADADLHWRGRRVWLEFQSPDMGFLGKPSLRDGLQCIQDSNITWKPAHAGAIAGPASASYIPEDAPGHRSNMVILPPTAKVRYENQRPDGGTIILEDWRTNAARLCDPDQALLKTELQDSGLKLHLEHRSGAHAPPEKIDLEILWPNNTRSARIAFAFPAQGVRAFDGDGMEIPLDGWLQVNRLTGSRILASGYANLELRLMPRRPRDGLWGNEFAYQRPLPTIAHQWRHEIRLPDFREEIEGLLATSDLLDAWVEVAIIHLGQPLYRVRVSRYLCPLSKLSRDVCLSQSAIRQLRSETLEQLPIHALRLEASGEEPLSLEPNLSQSVANGSWRFDPQSREPGSWLIYPGKTATEQIRPLLWPIDGEAPGNSPLTRALAIADRHKRAEALDEVITAMAADYLEPCWPELERLIEQLGHLPLSALDLWRRLAHSPDAMAALVFRMGNLEQSFVDRFTVELPFVWQTIPYETWKHACIRLRKQCEADFGEQHARTEAVKKIHDQIQWLVDQCPELEKLLRGVQSHTTDKQFPELCTLRHLASEDRPPQKMPKRPNFLDTT